MKKKRSETPLLDALRADQNRITIEEVVIFHGVPIYSFFSMPKGGLKEEHTFPPRCYGWVKRESQR